jgi:rhamnosyltransferase
MIGAHEICCVIVTYNPSNVLIDLVNTIKNSVGKIIVVDNNSKKDSFQIILKIAEYSKVFIIRNHENMGIAKALNQGVDFANMEGFKWVITFDQDTRVSNDFLHIISETYNLYPKKNNIGAIGLNAINANGEIRNLNSTNKFFKKRDYLITSGCLICVNSFYTIGGFREDFFIDNVDIEYSLRLKRAGKVSLLTQKIGMFHNVGYPKGKKIFWIKLSSTNHNIERRYYMARNHIILSCEYFTENIYFVAKLNYFFFLSIVKMIIIDDTKKQKLKSSMRGILDGVRYLLSHGIRP